LSGGDRTQTEVAENFLEVVIVGHAEHGRHEKLPDKQQQDCGAGYEVDSGAACQLCTIPAML